MVKNAIKNFLDKIEASLISKQDQNHLLPDREQINLIDQLIKEKMTFG